MSDQKIIKAKIKGMHCDGCVVSVNNVVKKIAGIAEFKIDNWKDGNAVVVADAALDSSEIETAISSAGYETEIIEERITSKAEKANGGFDYDLIIIGGGSAAFSAAIKARELGKTVLMANEGLPIGGTCVNVGCVPSKTLIRTAEAFYRTTHFDFAGIEAQPAKLNFKKAIQQKRELVAELRQKKYLDVLSDDPDVTIVSGRAAFVDQHAVRINNELKSAQTILIATGSTTFIPNINGLSEVNFHTNETLYELEELPEHLIILGGRYIALENAQMFARLGAKVTVLQRSERILPSENADLTDQLTEYLREEGVAIKTSVKIQSVTQQGDKIALDIVAGKKRETVEGSHLFVATGRKGNTADLGLEKIGIKTYGNGFVETNEFLQTSQPNIFAAGDITGEHLFVYTAAYEGALAVENAFSDDLKIKDYQPLPWVIFTDPQVAGVGLDEQGAEQAGIDYDVSMLPLSQVPRALAARNTRGFIKLLRKKQDDTLLGARILASEGSEMLMEVTLAIKYKIPVSELRQMFHPYLTLSEGIKLAAITFDRDVGKLSCCAA
ncbi:MAG: mercury(II) reductase [Calditrichaeota bacterium]|nr:mercury(II) reductase [Calditrichota bacterium]